jgi:hypothetical protein
MTRRRGRRGWFGESRRHSLASKGIKTKVKADPQRFRSYTSDSNWKEHFEREKIRDWFTSMTNIQKALIRELEQEHSLEANAVDSTLTDVWVEVHDVHDPKRTETLMISFPDTISFEEGISYNTKLPQKMVEKMLESGEFSDETIDLNVLDATQTALQVIIDRGFEVEKIEKTEEKPIHRDERPAHIQGVAARQIAQRKMWEGSDYYGPSR